MNDDLKITLAVDGQRYEVDAGDINGLEWRDIRQATGGMTAKHIIRGVLIERDFEAIAGLVWVWRKRQEPELAYVDVLRSLKFNTFGDADAEEGSDG